MVGYLLCINVIFASVTFGHLDGHWFGLISPASRSKMKRREGDKAGGIDIGDVMLKCKLKVVVGGGGGGGVEGAETDKKSIKFNYSTQKIDFKVVGLTTSVSTLLQVTHLPRFFLQFDFFVTYLPYLTSKRFTTWSIIFHLKL